MTEELSKVQKDHNEVFTLKEWRAEAERRFGPEPMDWKFRCPSCCHEQSVRDYKEAGAPEGAVGFSCVGRYLDGEAQQAFNSEEGQGPCNYAGGGLFRINPVTLQQEDGSEDTVFEFATVVCLGCGGTECPHVGCLHGKQAGA